MEIFYLVGYPQILVDKVVKVWCGLDFDGIVLKITPVLGAFFVNFFC